MKRTLRTIVVFSVIGAVLNVAVAWGHWFASDDPTHVDVADLELQAGLAYGHYTLITPIKFGCGVPQRSLMPPRVDLDRYKTDTAYREAHVDLPLVPVLPGFVTNTAFYGVLAWGTFLGLRWIQRHLRVSGGLCPYCGYDMTGLETCSECGR